MWYFSWVLGVGLAVAFGIINGMWHEFGAARDAAATAPEKEDGA